MVYKLWHEFNVSVALVCMCLLYFRHQTIKFCSLYYINCVVACDAGIIDSADFEDGGGGSELLAVLRGKV